MARPASPTTRPAPVPTPLSARRWVLLAVATLQQAGLTFVRFGLPAIAPFIRADLGLSLAQTGIVLGAFDLGALLTFYLTGLATDRWGERAVMAAGACLTGAVVALAAGANDVWGLAAVLALAGAGFPSSQVAGSHAVMAWFPVSERGLAMGVRQAGLPIGGFAAAAILPWAAQRTGWRGAVWVAASGCLLAGIITYLGLAAEPRERPGQAAAAPDGARPFASPAMGFWEAPRAFWRSPAIVAATVMAGLLASTQFSLTGYLPLYLVDHFGWRRDAAARMLLLVHLGGTAGRMAWGWVSDHLVGGDRLKPLTAVALCGAGAVAAISALSLYNPISPPLVAAVAFAAGFTHLGWNGLYVTLVSELAGAASATMLGLSMTLLYVSTMLSPPAFGHLLERFHAYPPAWLMLIMPQLAAIGTVRVIRRTAV